MSHISGNSPSIHRHHFPEGSHMKRELLAERSWVRGKLGIRHMGTSFLCGGPAWCRTSTKEESKRSLLPTRCGKRGRPGSPCADRHMKQELAERAIPQGWRELQVQISTTTRNTEPKEELWHAGAKLQARTWHMDWPEQESSSVPVWGTEIQSSESCLQHVHHTMEIATHSPFPAE